MELIGSCINDCEKASKEDEHDAGFFETCYNPISEENAFSYCDMTFKNANQKELKIFNCKLDFCRLCISIRDTMFNAHHSINVWEEGYSKCYEKFNKKD